MPKIDFTRMYLFGSREMAQRNFKGGPGGFSTDRIKNHITDETDWDYTCEHSEALEKSLFDAGWLRYENPHEATTLPPLSSKNKAEEEVAEGYAVDPTFHSLYTIRLNDRNCQLITRKNVMGFIETWESINPYFWYRYIWKSSPEFFMPKMPIEERRTVIRDIMRQIYNSSI